MTAFEETLYESTLNRSHLGDSVRGDQMIPKGLGWCWGQGSGHAWLLSNYIFLTQTVDILFWPKLQGLWSEKNMWSRVSAYIWQMWYTKRRPDQHPHISQTFCTVLCQRETKCERCRGWKSSSPWWDQKTETERESERNQSISVRLTSGQSRVWYSHGYFCDKHRNQTRQQAAEHSVSDPL